MVKKKHRERRHQKDPGEDENSSEDSAHLDITVGKTCPHVAKSINLTNIKKILKNSSDLQHCQHCKTSDLKNSDAENAVDVVLWLCLQCGYQGCDRNSSGQHALLHYQTPHSDSHALVLCLRSWAVWCYDCDEEIIPDSNKKLFECAEYMKKHFKLNSQELTSVVKKPANSVSGIMGPDISDELTSGDRSEGAVLNFTGEVETLPQAAKTPTNDLMERRKILDNSVLENLPKVKGLSNLGNTCFFNAVMQALAQTHVLCHLLDIQCARGSTIQLNGAQIDMGSLEAGSSKKQDLPTLNLTLGDGGPLTQALSLFLKEIQSMGKSRIINPGHLFGQVCKRAPQFRGAMQQDSHELLRHLLDGLKTEEIKRQQTGILKTFGLSEKVNPKKVEEDIAAKVKAYGKVIPQTLIDRIFGGQIISTVLCEECRLSSQLFEPFLDLSLQVTEEKTVRPGLVKRVLNAEPVIGCFGKNDADEKPSKHQEKKAKKQAKREAKLQRSRMKQNRKQPLNTNEESNDKEAVEDDKLQENGSICNDVSKGTFIDPEVSEPSDADVEDNIESESTCSLTNSTNMAPAIVGGKDLIDAWSPEIPTEGSHLNDLTDNLHSDSVDELSQKVRDVRIRAEILPTENIICSPNGEIMASEWDGCNGLQDEGSGEEKHDDEPEEQNGLMDGAEKEERRKQKQFAKLEWMTKSLTTLAPRYHPSSHECSIESCLNQFTAPELLSGPNKFGCENCTRLKEASDENLSSSEEKKSTTVYTNASKQLLIFNPPAILTLHLKRFQQVGSTLRKVNRHVEFPMQLDLAPFCSSICLGLPTLKKFQKQVMYSLYAVVEHSGRLSGGHYTVYVKVRPPADNVQTFLNTRQGTHCDINRLVDEMQSKLDGCCDNSGNCNGKCDGDKSSSNYGSVPCRWFHISDTHVAEVSESTVLKCQAYLLFYERVK